MNEKTIVEIAQADQNFTTLVDLVVKAGLADTLSGSGPFTVFAPTNEAFSKLPHEMVENLMNDTEKLKNVLLYHVVEGKHVSEDIMGIGSITSLSGKPIKISNSEGVMVNDALVVKADIEAKNGVIHVIDKVIMPQD
jgi:uncharacterized surface protein with fasciclin (FAS1) repeats